MSATTGWRHEHWFAAAHDFACESKKNLVDITGKIGKDRKNANVPFH